MSLNIGGPHSKRHNEKRCKSEADTGADPEPLEPKRLDESYSLVGENVSDAETAATGHQRMHHHRQECNLIAP